MPEEKYISIPELAKILGLSRIAVYKQVKSGKIKAMRIGRNYAIPERYLKQILGEELSESQREKIKQAVKRTLSDYGDVIKRLGQE